MYILPEVLKSQPKNKEQDLEVCALFDWRMEKGLINGEEYIWKGSTHLKASSIRVALFLVSRTPVNIYLN